MTVNKMDTATTEMIDNLCWKFSQNSYYRFPGYEEDDIYQEAWVICLKMISSYNPDKGASLKTFLYQVLTCRLYNLRRNKYERHGTKTSDKKKINNPESLDMDMSFEDDVASLNDLIDTINENIPQELRNSWNKMLEGVHAPKLQKESIMKIIERVLNDDCL